MKSKPLEKGVDDSKKRKRPSDACVARGGEAKVKKQPVTAKEKRLAAKEMAESRKKKRMRNYSLEKVLTQTCIENVGELLRTIFSKDVLYEVAVGGKDNVLEGITDRIHIFHNAIASGAARPKTRY